MSSTSLETTLELWSTTLRQAKQRIRPLFAAPSVAASANAFLDALKQGQTIQSDLFSAAQSRGWYQTMPADGNQINQAYQKFSAMS